MHVDATLILYKILSSFITQKLDKLGKKVLTYWGAFPHCSRKKDEYYEARRGKFGQTQPGQPMTYAEIPVNENQL
jgi:hypothetical protein